MSRPLDNKRARIYGVVAMIPAGRVSTYGKIAAFAGMPRQARQVGYALAALPDEHDVPWHRVINARGEISPRARNDDARRQRAMLEAEGIELDADGRISLARFGWPPIDYSGSAKT